MKRIQGQSISGLSRLVLIVGLLLAAIGIGAGGMAVAQSGSEAKITACVNMADGELRILDEAGEACVDGEYPLDWNIQGPVSAFGGEYISPNGRYVMRVDDSGIVFKGPSGAFILDDSGVTVDAGVIKLRTGNSLIAVEQNAVIASSSATSMKLSDSGVVVASDAIQLAANDAQLDLSAAGATLEATKDVSVESYRHLVLEGHGNTSLSGSGQTRINGNMVVLNCGSDGLKPVARYGDPVVGKLVGSYSVNGSIRGGSATVYAC